MRRTQQIRPAVLAAMASIALWPMMVHRCEAQPRPSGQVRVSADELDVLRHQYVLDPELAEERLRSILRTRPDRFLSRGAWSSDRLLQQLESVAAQQDGQHFLRGSTIVESTLDSLAIAFFWSPAGFSEDQLEHLENVSRKATGTPFLRGNPTLLKFLRTERSRFFNQPAEFSPERLRALEHISLHVSSLPFLRGSPGLIALLERDRMQFEERPQSFTDTRLSELDYISQAVQNRPFLPPDRDLAAILAAMLATIVVVLLFAARHRSPGRRQHGSRAGVPAQPDHRDMTVQEACKILDVPPDCTQAELVRAFRAVQKQYHPDLVAQLGPEIREAAERKTRRVNEAYQLLAARFRSEVSDA